MTTRLTTEGYLDALERSTVSIAELAGRLDLGSDVPPCPGWSARDVIVHLGGVHAWARGIVRGGSPKDPRPEPEGDLATWYAGRARDLLETLREVDPTGSAWSFSSDRTAGFWIRRQPHETEMHRMDLLLAAGEQATYDAVLAPDAVSEVLDVMLPRLHSKEPIAVSAPIRFVASDTGDEWVLRPSDEPGVVDYAHGTTADAGRTDAADPVAVTVTAPASELATGLWGRTPYALWAIEGDRAVLDALMNAGVTP